MVLVDVIASLISESTTQRNYPHLRLSSLSPPRVTPLYPSPLSNKKQYQHYPTPIPWSVLISPLSSPLHPMFRHTPRKLHLMKVGRSWFFFLSFVSLDSWPSCLTSLSFFTSSFEDIIVPRSIRNTKHKEKKVVCQYSCISVCQVQIPLYIHIPHLSPVSNHSNKMNLESKSSPIQQYNSHILSFAFISVSIIPFELVELHCCRFETLFVLCFISSSSFSFIFRTKFGFVT